MPHPTVSPVPVPSGRARPGCSPRSRRARGPVRLVGALLALATLTATGPGLPVGPAGAAAAATTPNARGRYTEAAAVWRLGTTRLGHLAAQHRTTPTGLADRLRGDPSLQLDGQGRLLVEEPPWSPAPGTPGPSPTPGPAPADPLGLHTRPGAPRTVFLDLTGPPGTPGAWDTWTGGPCAATPFDLDGDPATLDPGEASLIGDTVAELGALFAPFDLDVTTARPPAGDLARTDSRDGRYGTTVVLTDGTQTRCGAAGPLAAAVCAAACSAVTYLGVFDQLGAARAATLPAFVFTDTLGPAERTAPVLAALLAHTVGHQLGLFHDGQRTGCAPGCTRYAGQGVWAPVMGHPTARPVVQWARGEYRDATSPQDELAVLAARGLPTVPDDHGDTARTATPLAVDPTGAHPARVTGTITTSADVDAFTLTLTRATTVTLTATPTGAHPRLDLRVELADADGLLEAVADPLTASTATGTTPAGLDATATVWVPAGTHTVRVDGTGPGDPGGTGFSGYGSLGGYALSVAGAPAELPAPPAPVVHAHASSYGGPAPVSLRLTAEVADPLDRPLELLWSLPADGTVRAAATTATFGSPGVYQVAVTVSTPDGTQATDTFTVLVTDPATPQLADRSRTATREAALAELQPRTVQDTGAGFRLLTGAGVARDALLTVTGPPTATRPAAVALELYVVSSARTTVHVYATTTPDAAAPTPTWATGPPRGAHLGSLDLQGRTGRVAVPLNLTALWPALAVGAPITLRVQGAAIALASRAQGLPATLALIGWQPPEPARASTRAAGWQATALAGPPPLPVVTGLGTVAGQLVVASTPSSASSAAGVTLLSTVQLAVEPSAGEVAPVLVASPTLGQLRALGPTSDAALAVALGPARATAGLPRLDAALLASGGVTALAGLRATRLEDLLAGAGPDRWAAGTVGTAATVWRSTDAGRSFQRVLTVPPCGTGPVRIPVLVRLGATVYAQPVDPACAQPPRVRALTPTGASPTAVTTALLPAGVGWTGPSPPSRAVTLGDRAYLVLGGQLVSFDGTTVQPVPGFTAVEDLAVDEAGEYVAVLAAHRVHLAAASDPAGFTSLGGPLPYTGPGFVAVTRRGDGLPILAVLDAAGHAWRYR